VKKYVFFIAICLNSVISFTGCTLVLGEIIENGISTYEINITEDKCFNDEIVMIENFFLERRYYSIFSLGLDRNSGELYSLERDEYFNPIWFNNEGQQVSSPPCVTEFNFIPVSFKLLNLSNELNVDIMVFYTYLGHGGSYAVLYRLLNGIYTEVLFPMSILNMEHNNKYSPNIFGSTQFFIDTSDNIIMLYGDDVQGWRGYYFISFEDNVAKLRPIIEISYPYIYDHETKNVIGTFHDILEHWSHENYYVFGRPDIKIEPIISLEYLENTVMEKIRNRVLYP